jgi:hypothetical protein
LLEYMWGPNEAERMLELRNIVDFDHKDIIIRLTSGGSSIQKEVLLSIYRLYQGRLYRTFQTTEEFAVRTFPTPAVMMIEDEVHRLDYPDLDQAKGAFIVLRRLENFGEGLRVGDFGTTTESGRLSPLSLGSIEVRVHGRSKCGGEIVSVGALTENTHAAL